MPKIKEIVITDFRAYLGENTFSFNTKLGLANLVVIYGPNGFGKTSFFDAVEWTFSNQIKRFQFGVLKDEIESKDYSNNDLIVLSHRNSQNPGKIKISTDDGKYMERVVVPRKVQNEEVRFDYRQGILSGDYSGEDLFNLSETNVLTQDQIDSFLRFLSPEEKFNALKEFWPQGTEAANVFKTLTQYQRIIGNSILSTTKEVDRITIEITKLLNSENNIFKINSKIESINSSKFFDFRYPKISSEINDEVYTSIIDANETYKKLLKNSIEDKQLLLVKISDLLIEFAKYSFHLESIKQTTIEIEKLTKLENSFSTIRTNQNAISEIDESISKYQSQEQDAITLLNGWAGFLNEIYELSYLNSEISRLLESNSEIIKNRQTFENSENTLNYAKDNLSLELEKELRLNELIDYNKDQIIRFESDLRDGTSINEFIDLIISEIELEMSMLFSQRFEMQTIDGNYEKGIVNEDFDSILQELTNFQDDIKQLGLQINDLKIQQRQKETFSEGLERIVQWGLIHVKEHSLKDCPMCNTNFDDVDLLLNSIQSEKNKVFNMSDLEIDINDKSLILSYLTESCLPLEAQLEEIITNKINTISAEITEQQYNKDILNNRRADITNKIEYAENAIGSIFNIFKDQYSNIENNIDFDQVREQSNLRITVYRDNLIRYDNLINWKRQMVRESDNQLLVAKFNHETNQNNAQLILSRESYKKMEGLLIKYNLRADRVNLEYLTEVIDSILKLAYDAKKKRLEIAVLVDEIKLKLASEDVQLDEKELALQISGLRNIIETHTESVKKLETDYQIITGQTDYLVDTIRIRSDNETKNFEGLTNLKTVLEEFSADLEVIQENVQKNILKMSLGDHNEKLVKLYAAKRRIDNAKSACGNFINKGIDIYFNKEVINKIYGKIEPHPNLKEIDIRSEISDDDKAPKLIIRAKNDIDELNPTLYLSTGQVNVLSLSIFLAKAFELGSDKINTIFMDDPVQNLSDINVLSFIDLLRTLILDQDKQVIISTHDEKFFKLLQNKLSDDYFKAKYIELVSFGKLNEEGKTETLAN